MKNLEDIKAIVDKQRNYSKSRVMHPIPKRIEILTKLKLIIEAHSKDICEALYTDLGKSEFEAYLAEIDFVLHEISSCIKSVKKWSTPSRVGSPLTVFPARSFIRPEPLGNILIIGPWNYPFMLVMSPLIGAIAAGNTVTVKPSEVSSATSKLIYTMISGNFEEELIAVVEGGIPETTELLAQKFDHIFYTGNAVVGRIVMEKAAKHLTPVTLELGGKSPCLVFTEQIDLAAKRIIWGKFFNNGQTCVAPDYLLMPEAKVDEFIKSCERWLNTFYGKDISSSKDYGRIINENHFDRNISYLEDANVLLGGEYKRTSLFIAPTIIKVSADANSMQEEIFGPILPILTTETISQAVDFINDRDKPLACYGFLDKAIDESQLIGSVSSGGMVINDTLIHLSNDNLPFGGVGASGMGAYHGRHSFNLFSHKKAVVKRYFALENDLRYPPYKGKLALIRKIMSFVG